MGSKQKFDLAECYLACDERLKDGSFSGIWIVRLIHEVARLRGLLSIGAVAMKLGRQREKRLRAKNRTLEAEVKLLVKSAESEVDRG